MNKKELTKLIEISIETEIFLTEYASGVYGKYGKRIDVTKKVVKKFMDKSSKSDMEEVLSYLQFKDEMIADKKGASDLEDWIYNIIDKENDYLKDWRIGKYYIHESSTGKFEIIQYKSCGNGSHALVGTAKTYDKAFEILAKRN